MLPIDCRFACHQRLPAPAGEGCPSGDRCRSCRNRGDFHLRQGRRRRPRLGLMRLLCHVTLDNRPLEGATVTLTPEPFLGEHVLPASGVTDSGGLASQTIAEEFRVEPRITGVQCGWYKVGISKLKDGQEIVPAKYNRDTTLGCEVAPGANTHLRFALDSR